MPVMNGFEATREIRKVEREAGMGAGCQIVALTGLGSEVSRQEAFVSGTNLFLTKPVKLGEIKRLLSEERVPTVGAATTGTSIGASISGESRAGSEVGITATAAAAVTT